jgi:hypothetical protein
VSECAGGLDELQGFFAVCFCGTGSWVMLLGSDRDRQLRCAIKGFLERVDFWCLPVFLVACQVWLGLGIVSIDPWLVSYYSQNIRL